MYSMDFFDLVNISERYMELLNPTSTEKILKLGKLLALRPESRIVDFGCGFGELLALWTERYGISGIGIDVREYACERARNKMKEKGISDRIEIVCGKGAEYPFEKNRFDAALCIGASFIWENYEPAIKAMKPAIKPRGKLVIGEPYWSKGTVPPEYAQKYHMVHYEHELLQIAQKEGFDFEYVVRANQDDWDNYEADNWYGLVHWLEENPAHPERQQVIDYLHQTQEEYLRYGREYMGWAIYVLTPVK
jgi:SAM-dependent methyltransferase